MRYFLMILGLATLAACAAPMPPHNPNQAWVDLYASPGELLMADRLDGERLNDGRYFQVPNGAHELQARFQFEVNAPGGGMDGSTEPRQITCEIRVRYDDFAPGQRYRLEVRPLAMKAQGWLYDEQRNVLARAKVPRCGTF